MAATWLKVEGGSALGALPLPDDEDDTEPEAAEGKEEEGEGSAPKVSGSLLRLTLAPRYPLVGGWKTSFETGYYQNLHSRGLLRVDAEEHRHTLNMSWCPSVEGMVVEDYRLKCAPNLSVLVLAFRLL